MWKQAEDQVSLELDAIRFSVSPSVGGRITEFSLHGHNVLTALVDLGDWTNGGSTFWTSPQSDWGWPPDPTLDRGHYRVELASDLSRLTLISPRFNLASSQLSVSKAFWPRPNLDGVNIEYQILNHGPRIAVAPWEISRVPARGVSFFAATQPVSLGGKPAPTSSRDAQGVVWVPHAAQRLEAKLGASATRGYIAYANASLLFVKTFANVPAEQTAPGEAELEWYVKPGSYVEIEQQAALCTLEPGQSLSYRLSWFLHSLPEELAVDSDRDTGSEALVAFAEQLAKLS